MRKSRNPLENSGLSSLIVVLLLGEILSPAPHQDTPGFQL